MSDIVIQVENLSKYYNLGIVGTGTLSHDLNRAWARLRGEPDPTLKIGNEDNNDSDGHIWALRDITFEVKQGEVLGIIGRNGAGKSTLLKILSRVTAPTSGECRVKGRIASLLEVGTGFHPELTGQENIFLNSAILGMTKEEIRQKFDEIVAFAEVEKFIDTPVKRYSTGMYVRLAFAVAAHLEPEILIVDEVLAVGDAQFQKKCLGKMGDVAKEGRTVLFVSHNMAAVQQLCQKGIILSKGQLTYIGTSNKAVDQYINMSERKMSYIDDGFIDLENARDKAYQAKVFKKIRILDKNNTPRETFPMLSSMKIEVELENTENYPEADYCVALLTPAGQWLTSSATWMYPKEKKKIPERIILEIPAIKFSPGMYRIYLSMTQHTAGVYVDRVENAAIFYLEPVDLFNSGREFTSDCGLIVPEGELLLL
jgi:lipopolysaccharide transport system ATP-binding protein